MSPQASGLPPGPGHSATSANSRSTGRRSAAPKKLKVRLTFSQRFRRIVILSAVVGSALVFIVGVAVYFSLAGLIDDRLYGERERSLPRVYARPIEIRRGQTFTQQDLIARLNDIGYAHRSEVTQPGEFAVTANEIAITPRTGTYKGKRVRVLFPPLPRRVTAAAVANRRGIHDIQVDDKGRADSVELDRPVLTALMTSGARQKRRRTPLANIPEHMQQAVLAIEDRSFYRHPGVNPLRLGYVGIRSLLGIETTGGTSTITQQLSRMFFLADEFNAELQSGERGRSWGSYLRKAREGLMSLVLERKASKKEILELYLNDVYLGQRGSFAIHGVAEAARIFFGKDVANISISESAVIAGVIQSPAGRSPFANPKRSTERRNVVLRAMADEGYITEEQATKSMREPLVVAARGVDNEAPYFVDLIAGQVAEQFPKVLADSTNVEVYTTLDLSLQRAALDAVRNGLARVDKQLAGRRRARGRIAQSALIAVDPKSGEILALVGGRSYNQSQYNRVTQSRRQPGSVFKPFVFLSAFDYAAREGRTDLTPATITIDEPTTFDTETGELWEPKNYGGEYEGEITWRRALAMSRNLGTIHVGEAVGFDTIASFWRRVGVGTPPRGFPSITLGVFELTPYEVATAYTLFTNNGSVRPLHGIEHIEAQGKSIAPPEPKLKPVARPDVTYLVTNMMRSVVNEGTGAGARGAGFVHDAAGKTGTTNDLRDAWFVGFTPEMLTVVWVGYDDNEQLGLSGSQAALPIWTEFMKAAMAGRPNVTFQAPSGITFVEIDKDTGKLATPGCERTFNEAFAVGTEPTEYCPYHGGGPTNGEGGGLFEKLGDLFGIGGR
jgi:penicillin-binding protein 1B